MSTQLAPGASAAAGSVATNHTEAPGASAAAGSVATNHTEAPGASAAAGSVATNHTEAEASSNMFELSPDWYDFEFEEVAHVSLENILRRPGELLSGLPPQFFSEMPQSVTHELFNRVIDNVLANSALIASTLNQLRRDPSIGSQSRLPIGEELPPSSAPENAPSNPPLWEELVAEHPCSICCDLLAAPVILGCSHTFCGSCIVEYMSACESEDAEVVHCCPKCRIEILVDPTYEKLLDKDINIRARMFPDCDKKAEWKQRRYLYLRFRPDSRRRPPRHEEDLNPYWKRVIDFAVPLLTIAVIALMFACRIP